MRANSQKVCRYILTDIYEKRVWSDTGRTKIKSPITLQVVPQNYMAGLRCKKTLNEALKSVYFK